MSDPEQDAIEAHDVLREQEQRDEEARRDGDPDRYRHEMMIDAYDAGLFDEF